MSMLKLKYFITANFLFTSTLSFCAQSRDYFNPAMLEMDHYQKTEPNLNYFEEVSSYPPGKYMVDIYLNGEFVEKKEIEFLNVKKDDGRVGLSPCLRMDFLKRIGVKTDLLSSSSDSGSLCTPLNSIPLASIDVQINTQKILLSIPQAAISQTVRGYVPENKWDEGINALLLNYSVSGAENFGKNKNSSQFLNLRPGVNLGPWRIRNYSTYSRDNKGFSQWDNIYTYAQKNIILLKSQLTIGDSSSSNEVFESIPFRGFQLASDDEMIPDSIKGYAPVIRGVARTKAQVFIRQNGYIIYQTFVSPGAFEINDMYPTGGAGDLYITIKEADGSQQDSVVPFASLPVLQRQGRLKYSLTSGKFRSYSHMADDDIFSQGTIIYGLPKGFTSYGGGQFSSKYKSLSFGLGRNMGNIGALSSDITQSWADVKNKGKLAGKSYRVRYSKNIIETGTNFSIAGYKYSTEGYYSLQDTLENNGFNGSDYILNGRKKNRTEITFLQNLWDENGSLSLNVINENYWGSNISTRSIGIGYNNTWNNITYGLNYTMNENVSGGDQRESKVYSKDSIFSFNISVPFDSLLGNSYATYNMNVNRGGDATHNIGLAGTTLEDNNLTWGVQKSISAKEREVSGAFNADYRGRYGELIGGYAYDKNSQRFNYGIQGGVVASANNIVLGQPLGETLTLVKAQGAKDVSVINQVGVKTDKNGYAIVPYSSPYKKNEIQLNTETMPSDVDLITSSQNVVPTRGAVVIADFSTNIGLRIFMSIYDKRGVAIPFGAIVSDSAKKETQDFIVSDKGQVYLSGMNPTGILFVRWGGHSDETCSVKYDIGTGKEIEENLYLMRGTCI